MNFLENILTQLGGYVSAIIWLIALLVVGFCTYFLLVSLRSIAFNLKLFDKVDERTVHTGRVPRIGGVVFPPIFVFIVLIFTVLSNTAISTYVGWLGSWCLSPYWYSVLAGLLVLWLVGFQDDTVGMSYRPKFIGQFIAASILLLLGEQFSFDRVLGLSILESFGVVVDTTISTALSLLVILTVINSFNLIDGIDGLSSGISFLALLTYGLWFFWFGSTTDAILCWIMIPVLLAFMRVNIFATVSSGRKMFMGDTGSMSLGFLLSALALAFSTEQCAYHQTPSLPIVLVLSPILLPLLDLVWVFSVRILNGKNPFLPDRTHVHHRVMDTGLSQKQTLCVLLSLTAVFISLNFLLRDIDENLLLVIDLLLWGGFNLALYKFKKEK